MMNCTDARLAILDADLADLDGSGDSELSRHLKRCADCRAHAQLIIGGMAVLNDELSAAVNERAPSAAVSARAPGSRARDRRLVARVAAVITPLAAAAVLTLIVLDGRLIPSRDATPSAHLMPVTRVPDAPVVNATGSSGVAVMRTADPNITVVWNF